VTVYFGGFVIAIFVFTLMLYCHTTTYGPILRNRAAYILPILCKIVMLITIMNSSITL
jgi:hypothetical protein